jgi:8-oxo-dGTP diphosphatase
MGEPVTPVLAADIVIRLLDRDGLPIVLINRRNPPFGWALPGGFVDRDETVENAAIREAAEETSLQIELVKLLGCYSDPQRDQRFHTVSLVFVADAKGQPRAADDAVGIKIVLPDEAPSLVFDHDIIIADYRQYLATGEVRAIS